MRGRSKEMNEQIVRVVVKLTLSPDADVQEVLSECDYHFEHEQIIDTEIMGEQQ